MAEQLTVVDTQTSTRLDGWRLLAARALWGVLAGVAFAILLLVTPLIYAERLSQAVLPPLRFAEVGLPELGLTPWSYAAYFAVLQVIFALISIGVGLFIVWRRSDEPVALIVSFMLVFSSVQSVSGYNAWIRADPGIKPLLVAINALSFMAIMATVFLFPNGRFYPRWTVWLLLLALPLTVLDGIAGLGRPLGSAASGTPFVIALGGVALIGLWAQRLRYRRVLTPTQRQQVKWVLFGMALSLIPVTVFNIVDPFITPWLIENPPIRVLYRFGVQFFIFFIPYTGYAIAFAFAILRHRLWDIDYAINRSLGYAVVSVLLLAALLGIVLILQRIVLSPPVLAALAVGMGLAFNPARRRVQRWIDQRIYHLRFPVDAVAQRAGRPASSAAGAVALPGALTGTTLAGYVIGDWVGRGGMGEVYKAWMGDQVVAVKLLSGGADAETRARFVREGEILQRLSHPNIVRIYEYGEFDGMRYMVMDYLAGISLHRFLSQGGGLPLPTIRRILEDMTAALDYIHARGVVHRDLKPANIMLRQNPDGSIAGAILMDFGIAKSQTTSITGAQMMGTIDYMAPEQILESGTVDPRADVYALGVMLYEMATGTRPFQGGVGQVLFAHLRQPAPDPRAVAPALPPALALTIQRALAKDPADRPARAGDLLHAFA